MQDETSARVALAPAPARVVGADPHDFAGLYIRHRSSFTSHARRYLRDPRDADEVVQEAFLRLFLALPELETELQALAYCRRTITNLCIDRYRADARRPRLVALEGPTVDELAEDDTGDPVVRAEDAALVREALSQLPALHRAALVKREIEEKPLPVIAEELDVAEDSVKHLLFRARRALRKLLAGTSVAPGADVEATRRLRPAHGASSGLAGLLVLALIGLGSGPDLRAVPVVGVDLPDVLGVTAVAEAVSNAVRDAVEVIVPGQQAEAAASEARPSRRAVPSQALPATDGSARAAAGAPVAPRTSGRAGSDAAGRDEQAAPGAQPGPPVSGPVRVVTVVGGVPVVTVVSTVPPTAGLPGGYAPVTDRRPGPGISAGRGPALAADVPLLSTLPRAGVPAATPSRPVTTVVERATGAGGGSDVPNRSPRAEDAAQRTDAVAVKAAAKAEKAADKAADKATQVAVKTQEKAERAAERGQPAAEKAAVKAEQAVEKAAAKTDRAAAKADKAAEQAEKTAEKAAAKAAADAADERAAEKAAKAAEKAAKAAEKAAERAAALAAEKAAAERAAALAAEQAAAIAAAAAAAPVSSAASATPVSDPATVSVATP